MGGGIGSTVTSSGYGQQQLQGSTTASLATGADGGGGGGGSVVFDVDRRAGEDIAAMSNDRRQIVEALTEERAG